MRSNKAFFFLPAILVLPLCFGETFPVSPVPMQSASAATAAAFAVAPRSVASFGEAFPVAPVPMQSASAATAAAFAVAPRSVASAPVPRSNGSVGWVDIRRPAYMSLADIPALFPPK